MELTKEDYYREMEMYAPSEDEPAPIPVEETETKYVSIGIGTDEESAVDDGLEKLTDYLIDKTGLGQDECAIIMSMAGSAQIIEDDGEHITVQLTIGKDVIEDALNELF